MDEKPMAEPNNVREMNIEADLERVCEIWLKGITETAPPLTSGEPWDSKLPSFMDETRNIAKELYVCEGKGVIKGFITAGIPTNKNYILALYVDSDSRKKGIGTKLLDKLREIYRYLTLHVYEQNSRAIKFYKDHDFEVSGKKNCPDTGQVKLEMRW